MRASFYTLGCKVNQNETAALGEIFRAAGYTVAEWGRGAPADVYVVNSCTVTAGSDAKCRRMLRRAKELNPAAVTVLTGCFPQAFPEEAIPEADVVTGTADRANLVAHVQAFLETGRPVASIGAAAEVFETLPPARMAGRTRAFVKIQDGCNRRCAYCIIPTARGPMRSRPEADTLAELRALAQSGVTEVVFTGISLPSYGRDNGTCLADIVEKAAEVAGIRRIRLSSMDPDLLDAAGIERMVRVDKLCPQFHLSLQSGADKTLRAMHRPYTAAAYRKAAQRLRDALPRVTLTTDVIVGFPGETQEDFDESVQFVRDIGFLKVHVFPYSRRTGTEAATLPNQVPKAEKHRRAQVLQQAADECRAAIIGGMQGETFDVLLEQKDKQGRFTGYTETYIPVKIDAPKAKTGDILRVKLGAFDGQAAAAQPV